MKQYLTPNVNIAYSLYTYGFSLTRLQKMMGISPSVMHGVFTRRGYRLRDKKECNKGYLCYRWKGNKLNTTCPTCGKSLRIRKGNRNRHSFCSRTCYWKSKEYLTVGNDILDCRRKEWKVLANKCRARDGHVCKRCHKTNAQEIRDTGKGLVVHHLIPRRKDPSLALVETNLITCCHKCHGEIEHSELTSLHTNKEM